MAFGLRRARRMVRRHRRPLALVALTLAAMWGVILILQTLSHPRGGPVVASQAQAPLIAGSLEISPEEQDYFRRAQPLEQQRILQERQDRLYTAPPRP